ncbi:TRAP transporter substrate-binding protein DctP [Loktanella sp. SALINAS62]|uniref:TRAP transporter substrate-binding protein n=1 Tax=Loktanella sp. SALINAS62 TaxID=2706124 RepID=UPI001B8B6758|nr:TRAP transporter substrate-binding protein DctP [Loktanella sp. SALINAS62]MBS1304271.1 C4-dicarboxylate ABC transporter substrate-binding protein [Loktanella sp. SALINAS62]
MKHLITGALTAALLSGTAVAAWAQDATYTLRATANSNENDEDYDGLVVFKNYVESASNGQIGVELFIGTQLCSTGEECLEGVAEGSIDIYISTSGGTASLFPFVQVLDLPYLMSDDRVAEAVLDNGSPFVATMRQKVSEASDGQVRLMTIGNTGGWRNFANTVRPVQTPADLEGLKIRTVPAELPQVLTSALGASPTGIPWPELFTSLQTGVVEGTKNGITDIMSMKFPDAGLQYLTLDGHAYMGALWFMNNEKFMDMPEDLRKVVADGFYQLQQATFASPKRKSIAAYQAFTDGGGAIYVPTPDEKQMFLEAAAPVQDWFRENVDGGSEVLDSMLATVEEVQTQLDAEYAAELN